MPFIVNCPECERMLRLPDELEGRSCKCPTCGRTFTGTVASATPTPARSSDDRRTVMSTSANTAWILVTVIASVVATSFCCCGGPMFIGILSDKSSSSRNAEAEKATPASPKASPEELKAELEGKIKELEAKQAACRKAIEGAEQEKRETVEHLKKSGVKKSADLKGNPRGQRYADRLTQLVHELNVLRKKAADYEEAIDTARFALHRFERVLILKQAGITDEELTEVTTIIAKLNDKLNTGSDGPTPNPLKVESVLEKELTTP